MTDADAPDAFGRFRMLLAADADLQRVLARHERPEAFVADAVRAAAKRGFVLGAEQFGPAAFDDPLGLARMAVAPSFITRWPEADWLPVDLVRRAEGSLAVDWAHFAGVPLVEPFFAGSLRRAVTRPLNRLLRLCTPLDHFVAGSGGVAESPDGIIFHMSRCGSTLAASMLGTLHDALVLSEPAPLDTLVRLIIAEAWAEDRAGAALTALLGAYGRGRPPGGSYIVKLNCWHILALDRFRAAFPGVPWIFLYREPAEVLASQMRQLGPELDPALMHPSWYGLAPDPDQPIEDYCARVLARVCDAAVDGLGGGGGLAVNYDQLPAAVASTIAGHFGLSVGQAERKAMTRFASRDIKRVRRSMAPDTRSRSGRAMDSPAVRRLRAAYLRLEALRAAGG